MTRRGPIDFLAALVVEFGGLVLLLGAIPLLSSVGTGPPAAQIRRASTASLPWPRGANPTPWDHSSLPELEQAHPDDRSFVETQLERQSGKLMQGLVGHIEQVLEERLPDRQPESHVVITGVSQAAPQLPSMTASTSAAAQAPYDVR